MLVLVVLTIVGIRASALPMRGPYLGALGYGFALAPLLLVAARLWIDRVEGSYRVDVGLSLISLLATGAARPGLPYVGFILAFLAAVVGLQRSGGRQRPAFAEVSSRARRIGLALLLTATVAGVGAAIFAQIAYAQIRRRFQHAFDTAYEDTTGLSETARLGKAHPLLKSDAVVLRVSGPSIDRLRGNRRSTNTPEDAGARRPSRGSSCSRVPRSSSRRRRRHL